MKLCKAHHTAQRSPAEPRGSLAHVERVEKMLAVSIGSVGAGTKYGEVAGKQAESFDCSCAQHWVAESNAMQPQCKSSRNAMQCNAMQCNAMQCNAMQCNAMQCNVSFAVAACSCGLHLGCPKGFRLRLQLRLAVAACIWAAQRAFVFVCNYGLRLRLASGPPKGVFVFVCSCGLRLRLASREPPGCFHLGSDCRLLDAMHAKQAFHSN